MKKVSENKKKIIKITTSDINNMVCETINQLVNNNKPNLTVLWLDDVRQPERYLAKQKQSSQTSSRNIEFYQRIMAKYNVQFVWVHNLDEFMNYITTHDMPGLVSFDFDLGRDILKGSECAKWLKQYCMENNKPLPKYYVHSANNKAQTMIPNELGTQHQLNEKVYINNVNDKKKQLGLTYTKGRGGSGDGIAQQFKNDKLGTTLMDQDNSKTIIKTLKGNIMSYNITDIYGERVMHYFKKYFDHQKATVDVKYQNGETDEYELTMLQSQFNDFMEQFKKKVGIVINDVMQTFENTDDIVAISIYPVPSSSNFNITMADELSKINVNGLPVQVINQGLFNKDLRDLQKDTDFINRNKDYYNAPYFSNVDSKSLETYVDHYLNQYKSLNVAHTFIEKANQYVKQLITAYRNYNSKKGAVGERAMQKFANYYTSYYDSIKQAIQASTYDNLIDDEREQSKSRLDKIAQKLKYTKGPSVENRTGEIWDIVRRYLKGSISPITGKEYKMMDVCFWQPTKFQIKNLANGVRMGLKNIYNVNQDQEFVQNELNKIKNTLFVIFDDNISGGATLGDICYQAKSLGIENIIPITFGKMAEKTTINNQPLTSPSQINF